MWKSKKIKKNVALTSHPRQGGFCRSSHDKFTKKVLPDITGMALLQASKASSLDVQEIGFPTQNPTGRVLSGSPRLARVQSQNQKKPPTKLKKEI